MDFAFAVITNVKVSFFSFCSVEYLDLVDLEEKKDSQESDARQKLDKGERKATVVPQLLEKLSRPDQMLLYYCGGLESLSQALIDCECSFCLAQVFFSL